jgi:cytochrome c-type biogenesis protein CcsB
VAAAGGGWRLAGFGNQAKGKENSAAALDAFNYRAVTLGFLLLAGGIILGSVWANQAWGSYWSWDPKETWSLVTWLVYAVTLHLWRARGWRGTRFAWLTLVGLAFVIFTYFGVNYLLSGMHSYR